MREYTVVRPVYTAKYRALSQYPIAGLGEASGSGTETIYTPTGIIESGPVGSGLYGVPPVYIFGSSGGQFASSVILSDESGAEISSGTVTVISGGGTASETTATATATCGGSAPGTNTGSWASFGVSGVSSKTYYMSWVPTMTNSAGGAEIESEITSIEIENGTTITDVFDYLDVDYYSGLVKLDTDYRLNKKKFAGPLTVPAGALVRIRIAGSQTRPASGTWTGSVAATLHIVT